MNCYYCLIETGGAASSAFAICQRCSAGICEVHLVAFHSIPGMAGGGSLSILCAHCAYPDRSRVRTYSSVEEHMRLEGKRRFSWWRWFRRDHAETLPEAEQVIAAVERFLKQG